MEISKGKIPNADFREVFQNPKHPFHSYRVFLNNCTKVKVLEAMLNVIS